MMFSANRQKLTDFTLLVTRRLYNYLATAVSAPDHVGHAVRELPRSVGARAEMLQRVASFSIATRPHRINQALRDHSVHHRLHVTSAQMTFESVDGSIGGSARPRTEVMLSIGAMRRGIRTRSRRRRDEQQSVLDTLPDQVPLLPMIEETKRLTLGLVADLLGTLEDPCTRNTRARSSGSGAIRAMRFGSEGENR